MHEVHGSNPIVIHFVFQCIYQYVPSTYPVQTRFSVVHTSKRFWNPSTNKYVFGMAECSIGTYSSIVQYHLVLLCTGTYYLVRRFTILAVSAFRFGTTYVESWTVISAGVFYATGRHPFQYPKTKQISYLPGLAGDRFFYALGDSKLRRFFKTWMLND